MSRFWSQVARELVPYVPGEQPKVAGLIKLNTNENPYPPSAAVQRALQETVLDTLRLYPDPASSALCEAVAELHGVTPAQVFVGNGSDEVLAHAFHALLQHEAPVLFPDVTYSFYPVYCRLYGIAYETIPLRDDFSLAVEDFARPNGGIVFPNPNAPTGMALPLMEVQKILRAHPDSVVLVDEAYVDFGAESAVVLVADHPNLLVVRTLSKSYALAGLRVGYAIGHPDLIAGLVRIKDSFNSYPLGRLAQIGALAAVRDQAYLRHTCATIAATRDYLARQLSERGFTVLPSQANFVFVRHEAEDGAPLAALLREHNILVRHSRQPARIAPYLRITIGTPEHCQALVDVLDTYFLFRSQTGNLMACE